MKHVLVNLELNESEKASLEACFPEAVYRYTAFGHQTVEDLEWADAVIGNVDPKLLKGIRLDWFQLFSAGADAYYPEGQPLLSETTVLTNSSGAYGLSVAEHMFGMTLALMKKLPLYRDNQKKSLWQEEGAVGSFYGAKVLIIGLGDIGLEYAKRAKAFGAEVIGVRKHNTECPEGVDVVYLTEDVDRLLPEMDVVVLFLPGTQETQLFMTRERLERMNEQAILVNGGRGTAIDLEALCDVIEAGKIASAALDVTDPEPLPEDHRLWKLENVFLTPHVSGGFHMEETRRRVLNIVRKNLTAYANGTPFSNIVSRKLGY
ncbi:MAG: hypothetical protein PWQ12_1572 [Clostridiales bacterium]|jgi:phosphoglycerate dehydrogenase-like enzyme|nr:hypothetical protein [Clostridiales bacterium]